LKVAIAAFSQEKSEAWLKYLMKFEFDEAKSQSNQNKHGIDFLNAQQL